MIAAETFLERGDGWVPGGDPPSEIHVLLHESGLIPDPYKGFDEHAVQCKPIRAMIQLVLTCC